MKIAVLGTRGIPNHYGGFEQFAQYLSLGLVAKGHHVSVYNSHNHPYRSDTWNGVNIIHCYDPENKMGTAGQFVYDLNCIIDTRSRDFDIILNLGYTSSSVWSRLFPRKPVLITNMDGLEWKRTKYGKAVRRFLVFAEKLAVKHSDVLVADSQAIKKYLQDRYNRPSHYIAYGADPFTQPDRNYLKSFGVDPYCYNMLIARMEPENNIETILDGVAAATSGQPFLVIGNYSNQFGKRLAKKFVSYTQIRFLGPIYDLNIINNLRYFSNLYFHGHSVGGTNPSLLEAMASNALVAAHDNTFNRHILGDDAFYFATDLDVKKLVDMQALKEQSPFMANNLKKINEVYSWANIIDAYESLMLDSIKK